MSSPAFSQAAFNRQLKKNYTWYTGGFILFIILLAIAEQMGMSRAWIGYWFLFATIGLYAGIGIMSRTSEVAEYYVAGRRVPAFFNGMATGADWMSAASFIGMAGTLFLAGFDGLAWVMGWTGGYCLVALFLAPYLRKFGQFTIPDFLAERYGGNIVRTIGIISAITCSFVYVVAQIYGVGLITSRFTGLEFGVGVFVGLAGILVCSMLGGMRAVTWTQVAQYIILIIAYLTPVVWLGMKHTGIPVPQFAYGYTLQKVTELEKKITNDPKEQEVRKTFADRAAAGRAALADPDKAYAEGKARVEKNLADLKAQNAPADKIAEAERAVAAYPTSVATARSIYQREAGMAARSAGPRPHAEAFVGKDEAARNTARWNFIGIVFCMMFGTAALPHILMRYYTTPSVQQARVSVFWSLFFIFLLYFTAPCPGGARQVRHVREPGGQLVRFAAGLGGGVGEGGSGAVEHHRHQPRRHRAVGGGGDRRRPDRAGDPRDRGPAVRGVRPGRGRRPGGGALDRRRAAADHRQRAVARPVLQDDRPACFDHEARDDLQGPAGGGGDHRGLRDLAQAGRHPVPGRRGVLARGVGVLPAARAGRVLEARQQVGRDHRHGRGPGCLHLLHDAHLPVLHQHGRAEDGPVVRPEPGVGGDVRPADRPAHHHHRQLPDRRRRPGRCRSWSSTCATRT